MGRMEDAQRRARREEGLAPEPIQLAQQSSPWEFGDEDRRGVAARAKEPAGPVADDAPEERAEAEPARRRHRVFGRSAKGAVSSVSLDSPARERLVVSKDSPPMLGEQFRTLAATLHRAQQSQKLRSLMVTSASVGDGKSLTAANLALTLSESYERRVLLVDADLRRPSLHQIFRLSNASGLSDGLRHEGDETLALAQVTERLTLLPAGRPEADPMAGLASERMRHIIEEATTRFDWVIVDTPPVGLLADASLLSAMLDATLLVVRAGVTPFPEVEGAVAALGREHVLGIVLNAADPAEVRGKHYYGYYYGREGKGYYGADRQDE
jgi:capsular exopolysaccharide synthesis family protein